MSLAPVSKPAPNATADEEDAELAALRSATRKQAEALRQEFRTEMSYLNSFYSVWNIHAPRAYALRPLLAFGGSALALAVFGILTLVSLALPVSTTIMAASMPGIAATALLNAGIRRYRERVVQLEHSKHELSQIQKDVRKCRERYNERVKELRAEFDAQRDTLKQKRQAESVLRSVTAPDTHSSGEAPTIPTLSTRSIRAHVFGL